MELTTQTLQLARISGMDYKDAADAMTVATRAFRIEMEDAQRVTDVYSKVAAVTASDSQELATAMSKTASSAASVGVEFENITAMMAVVVEQTRESATNIGSAFKSIISRFGEMKSGITEVDGEIVDYNKTDAALRSVKISLKDAEGQFRDFDDVIYELAAKWDTLSRNTQRYIATVMAGNRQQSRFLALVENYDRLMEVTEAAANSEDAGLLQYSKTLDSLETKLNRISTSFQQFYMSLINGPVIGSILTTINGVLEGLNNIEGFFSQGGAIVSILAGVRTLIKLVSGSVGTVGSQIIKQLQGARTNAYALGVQIGQQITKGIEDGSQRIGRVINKQLLAAEQQAKKQQRNSIIGTAASIGGAALSTWGVAADSPWLTAGGAALSGTGMGSAFGVPGMIIGGIAGLAAQIPNLINALDTNTQRQKAAEKATKATEEANIKRAQTKEDYRTLKNYVTALKEATKARDESAESYQTWLDLNNEIASAYPELISYIDSEGNSIVTLTEDYEGLAIAKQKALEADSDYYNKQIESLKLQRAAIGDRTANIGGYGLYPQIPDLYAGLVSDAEKSYGLMSYARTDISDPLEQLLIEYYKQFDYSTDSEGNMLINRGFFGDVLNTITGSDWTELFNAYDTTPADLVSILDKYPDLANYKKAAETIGKLEGREQDLAILATLFKEQKYVVEENGAFSLSENGTKLLEYVRLYNSIISEIDNAVASQVALISDPIDGLEQANKHIKNMTLAEYDNKDDILENLDLLEQKIEDNYITVRDFWNGLGKEQKDAFTALENNKEAYNLRTYSNKLFDFKMPEKLWRSMSEDYAEEFAPRLARIARNQGIEVTEKTEEQTWAQYYQQIRMALVQGGKSFIAASSISWAEAFNEYSTYAKANLSTQSTATLNELERLINKKISGTITAAEEELFLALASPDTTVAELIPIFRKMGFTLSDATTESLKYVEENYVTSALALVDQLKENTTEIDDMRKKQESGFSFDEAQKLYEKLHELAPDIYTSLDTTFDTINGKNYAKDFEGIIKTLNEQGIELLDRYIKQLESIVNPTEAEQYILNFLKFFKTGYEQSLDASIGRLALRDKTTSFNETLQSILSGIIEGSIPKASEVLSLIGVDEAELTDEELTTLANALNAAEYGAYQQLYDFISSMLPEGVTIDTSALTLALHDAQQTLLHNLIDTLNDAIKGSLSATEASRFVSSMSKMGIDASDYLYKTFEGYKLSEEGALAAANELIKSTGYSKEIVDELVEAYQGSDGLLGSLEAVNEWLDAQKDKTSEIYSIVSQMRDAYMEMANQDAFNFMDIDAFDGKADNFDKFIDSVETYKNTMLSLSESGKIDYKQLNSMATFLRQQSGAAPQIEQGFKDIGISLQEFTQAINETIDTAGQLDLNAAAANLGIDSQALFGALAGGMEAGMDEVATAQIEYWTNQREFLVKYKGIQDALKEIEPAEIDLINGTTSALLEENAAELQEKINSIFTAGGLEGIELNIFDTFKTQLALNGNDIDTMLATNADALEQMWNTYISNILAFLSSGNFDLSMFAGGQEGEQVLNNTLTQLAADATASKDDLNEAYDAAQNGVTATQQMKENVSGIAANMTSISDASATLSTNIDTTKTSIDSLATAASSLVDTFGKVSESASIIGSPDFITSIDSFKALISAAPNPQFYEMLTLMQSIDFTEVVGNLTTQVKSQTDDTVIQDLERFKTLLSEIKELKNIEIIAEANTTTAQTNLDSLLATLQTIRDMANITKTITYNIETNDNINKNIFEEEEDIPYSEAKPTFGGKSGKFGSKMIKSGNVAVNGTPTLVGELGPELAVYDDMYHLLGRNGAEFVNLPDDTIVFNHKQTANIFAGRKAGRARALVNGTGPAAAGGIDAAIEQIDNIISLWQSIKDSSVQDLINGGGGSSGGGGGGGEETIKAHIEDLQEWYNLTRQIADLEQKINNLVAERENILDGRKYLRNLRLQQEYLQKQQATQQVLLDYQQRQLDLQAEHINNNAIWSKFLTVDESGLLQYIKGNETNGGKGALQVLQQLNEMSGADQEAYIKSLGYSYTDTDGNALTGADLTAKFYEELQAQIDAYDALYDTVNETTETIEGLKTSIEDINQEIRDNQKTLEQNIYDIIVAAWEKEISTLQEQTELIQEANDAYVNGISNALQAEKDMYSQNQSISDREKLQRQLSLLRRAGGSASEISSLEEQLNSALKDEYFNRQQEAIDSIRDANEKQLDALNKQIQIQQEALDYQKENGVIWTKVYEVMGKSYDSILAFITGNADAYFEKSTLVQEDMLIEWAKQVGIYTEEKQAADYYDIATGSFGDIWSQDVFKKYSTLFGQLSSSEQGNIQDLYSRAYSNARLNGLSDAEARKTAQDAILGSLSAKQEQLNAANRPTAPTTPGGTGGNISESGGTTNNNLVRISASSSAGGTLTVNGRSSVSVTARTPVTYNAVAKSGYQFVKITGAKNSTSPTGTIIPTGNISSLSIYATFKPIYTSGGGGSDREMKLYANGGKVGYDQIAMVHADESVLNPKQAKDFDRLVTNYGKLTASSNPLLTLGANLATALRGVFNNTTNTEKSISVSPGAVVINVDHLNNSYDVDDVANDVMDKMYDIAAKATNRGVNRR